MSYIVGQYNKGSDETISMTPLSGGSVARLRPDLIDDVEFPEEYIQYNAFKKNRVYYFHGLIKKIYSNQVFDISLMNDDNADEVQIVHTTEVEYNSEGWADIEFVFKPVKDFNRLVFFLQRNRSDYGNNIRYPVIVALEISEVKNLLPIVTKGPSLLKAGIQTEPGTLLVINGEGIRVGKSGIYEVRNGLIEIDFFSVLNAGQNQSDLDSILASIDNSYYSVNLENVDLSKCLIDDITSRTLPDFSLDYLYEQGKGGNS